MKGITRGMGIRSVTLSPISVADDRLQRKPQSTIRLSYRTPFAQSYWAKVERKSDDECWPWLASTNNRGYGAFRGNGAHRIAYIFKYGPISSGLELDHLCQNRWCQNPEHLEEVTHAENMRRYHNRKLSALLESVPLIVFKKHASKQIA